MILKWKEWFREHFSFSDELSSNSSPLNYLKAFIVALTASIPVFILEHFTYEQFSNITSLFIVSVLYSSVYFGIGPAIFNALLCTSVYEYFFIPPFFNFGPHGIDNLIKFFAFVIAALITNMLSVKVRNYALDLKEREEKISMLHELSEYIADASNLDEVMQCVEITIRKMLGVSAKAILCDSPAFEGLARAPHYQPAITLLMTAGITTGTGTQYCNDINALFIPLKTGRGIIGIMYVTDINIKLLKTNFMDIIQVLAPQIALGVERILLQKEKEKALLDKERESLRSALLSSVSHDLKTPLASIIGSASMLRLPQQKLSEQDRNTLITTIEGEAERLHRFIVNLLEITKLESGAILPNFEQLNLDDVIDSVLKRMRDQLKHHPITLESSEELLQLNLDATLMQHVFINLLENAVKYSDHGTTIIIRDYRENGNFFVEVEDEGCGIPEKDLKKVFDKFYRVMQKDSTIAGTGLGLSICHSIVVAHGGTITAISPEKKYGTIIRICLPLSRNTSLPILHKTY